MKSILIVLGTVTAFVLFAWFIGPAKADELVKQDIPCVAPSNVPAFMEFLDELGLKLTMVWQANPNATGELYETKLLMGGNKILVLDRQIAGPNDGWVCVYTSGEKVDEL